MALNVIYFEYIILLFFILFISKNEQYPIMRLNNIIPMDQSESYAIIYKKHPNNSKG